MKDSTLIILAIVLILVIGGGFSLPKIDLGNFNPFAGFGVGGDGAGHKVDVQKPLKFALTDAYAGSALASKTLKVYASDGSTLLETLTTGSDGTITTAFTYDSGDIIWVYYESSNDKMWWKKDVPKMNPKDAEALSYNYIKLAAFSIGTYTTDTLKHGATTIADAGEYNFTTSGTIQTFTYSLANTGSDNTGLMESYDPIYQMKYSCVVYATLSGTSYEKIIVYGFDYDYTLGTTHYLATEADSYALTKHKVGNRKLMQEEKVDFKSQEDALEGFEREAKTAMLVAIEGHIAGVVAVADTLKDDSVHAIRELERMGIRTTILTGDNERTAKAIAQKVGISRVLAEVLPDQKVKEIQRLQEDGETVAMVGDGINDAPALTAANVGIAIGTGTDIAIESADVTLVRGQLSGVVTAVKLSRATFRKIKQNLFWAFFYNAATIPLAMLGLAHPALAEIAMATSSVSVVTNANLLRQAKITFSPED